MIAYHNVTEVWPVEPENGNLSINGEEIVGMPKTTSQAIPRKCSVECLLKRRCLHVPGSEETADHRVVAPRSGQVLRRILRALLSRSSANYDQLELETAITRVAPVLVGKASILDRINLFGPWFK